MDRCRHGCIDRFSYSKKNLSIQTNGVISSLFSKHLQYFSAGENQSCKEVNNSLSPESFKILVNEGCLGKINRDSSDTNMGITQVLLKLK